MKHEIEQVERSRERSGEWLAGRDIISFRVVVTEPVNLLGLSGSYHFRRHSAH